MATKKKALGNDPLFSPDTNNSVEDPEEEVDNVEEVTAEKIEEVKKTIAEMKKEVQKYERQKKVKNDNYMRMTFIIRRDLMDKLRDFCYTERVSQKVGLERILEEYLSEREDLVAKPRKK